MQCLVGMDAFQNAAILLHSVIRADASASVAGSCAACLLVAAADLQLKSQAKCTHPILQHVPVRSAELLPMPDSNMSHEAMDADLVTMHVQNPEVSLPAAVVVAGGIAENAEDEVASLPDSAKLDILHVNEGMNLVSKKDLVFAGVGELDDDEPPENSDLSTVPAGIETLGENLLQRPYIAWK